MGKNLPFALLVGILIGLSPHTSGGRLLPSIAGGLLAAVLALWWRSGRTVCAPVFERPAAQVWGALLLYAAVFGPTFAFLLDDWTASIWQNGHGILLPLLLWSWAGDRLRRQPDAGDEEGSPVGLVLLGLGVALAIHAAYSGVGTLGAVGLVVSLPGVSLLLLGPSRTRTLAPVFCLAVFLVPLPTVAAYWLGLPYAAAFVSETALELAGTPVLRYETLLSVPGYRFAVSDRCSGVAALYGGLALAVFLAFHTRSVPRRVLLLAAPWVLVVASTGLRIAVLIFVARHTGLAVLEMATHGLSGIAAFWIVVAGLMLLADRRQLREDFA